MCRAIFLPYLFLLRSLVACCLSFHHVKPILFLLCPFIFVLFFYPAALFASLLITLFSSTHPSSSIFHPNFFCRWIYFLLLSSQTRFQYYLISFFRSSSCESSLLSIPPLLLLRAIFSALCEDALSSTEENLERSERETEISKNVPSDSRRWSLQWIRERSFFLLTFSVYIIKSQLVSSLSVSHSQLFLFPFSLSVKASVFFVYPL